MIESIRSLAIILIAFNLLALASGLLCRRWPVAALSIPLALYLLVQQAWWQIPKSVEAWSHGGAMLLVPYGTPMPENPDPDLRLRWTRPWPDEVSPAGVWLHNATLLALDRTIRPAAGAWQGVIPSLAEAQSRLDAKGQDVLFTLVYGGKINARGGRESAKGVLGDGAQIEEYIESKPPCGEAADGTFHRRVARLDGEAFLESCGDRTEIFTAPVPGLPYMTFWSLRNGASPSATLGSSVP